MARDRLQQLIASLHEELGSSEALDDRSRELLQHLIGDIETIAADKPDARGGDTAVGQLEEAALRFESDHPRLSAILGEIMDTLGKLGI
jgi:hypothetical protein